MKDGQRAFLRYIEALFDGGAVAEQTDRQLLEVFTGGDRMAAELAFTVLVKRHGPMVYRACQAILSDPHAAEDAFQATFLVLARKAGGLWVRDSLGPWLLSVAQHVARCARAGASRRRAHERTAVALAMPTICDEAWDDRDAILHEELSRLPARYRAVAILCDLEGLTQKQAADRLGWPDGTVRSRLARARDRLRERLTRRGMAPAVIPAAPRPSIDLTSAALVQSTVQAALRPASGQVVGAMAAAGVVPAAVATLAEKGMRTMWLARSKMLACVLVLLGGSTAGVLAFARRPKDPAKPGVPEAQAVAAAPPAVKEGRVTDTRPGVSRVLPVAEGGVRGVAFGPEGRIAAGYAFSSPGGGRPDRGGVVIFDARGERVRPAPLKLKEDEGPVRGVAFGPEGRIAVGYDDRIGGGGVVIFDRDGGGDEVIFDRAGERFRPGSLDVKEGVVMGMAFGPEGRIAASYGSGAGCGVVVFDARGERVRPAPLKVEEGEVWGVAFGPEGRIAVTYSRGFAGGGAVIFDARGERLRHAPLKVDEGEGMIRGVAFGPEGRIAVGYVGRRPDPSGVVVFDARGERVRPAPLKVEEGEVWGVAFGPEGRIAAGYEDARGGGGVVLFDAP
jgi:RNA polymerase sigma factor (sigma-70 family)